MAHEPHEPRAVIPLAGNQYVLAPQRIKVGDEYHDIVMQGTASEPVREEMARAPSDAKRLFAFYWGRPGVGGVRVISQVGNFLIPSGSTRVGYTSSWEPIALDPLPDDHKQGPWLAGSFTSSDWSTPLSEPSLHRRFAGVSQRETAIRRFASRHGLLGHGAYILSPIDNDLEVNCRIESIRLWRREIASMRRLVEIWDHAERGHAGVLGSWVRWAVQEEGVEHPKKIVSWIEPASKLEESNDPSGKILQNETLGFEDSESYPMPEGWREGDVIEPAKYYVSLNINRRLEGHVKPCVMPFSDRDILLWPDCLLSALYVHFAWDVGGQTHPKIVCKGCGQYFSPKHGSQLYCEPLCSKRDWWHRERGKKPRVKGQDDNA